MAFNLKSKEFFINLDKKDIPPKNHPDYLALRDIETEKCKDGVNINGIHIWGSLYYHLNHNYLDVDKIDNRGIISTVIERPGFRDNEWLVHEAYNQAYDSKLGFEMMSARQLSKTSTIVSLVTRQLFLYPNSEVLGLFSSKPDKQSFTKKLQIAIQNNTDFLVVPNIDKDLNKEYIRFGITEKDNEPYVYSKLYMYLTDGGVNSEIGAGKTLSMFFVDEFAKSDIVEAYEAVIPAIRSSHGLRCSPIMTGCVCEGTKIITNEGKFINIENLQKQQGIVGYNGLSAVKQLITHINPPQEKECVRIETEGGEYIECSTDHPFLMSFPHFENKLNNTRRKKVTFKRADSLKRGDQLSLIKDIPIFGEYENCNARLLGMLIGDGYYGKGGASIGGADFELHNFIEKNYDFKLQSNKGFTTKTGLDYKHYYIRKSGKILKDAGINFQTKLEKRLPTNIETYTKESLAELLGGYYDADGNVNIRKDKKAMRVVLTSVVEELLKEVKQQLLKFGITSNIVKENRVFKKGEYINSINHIFRLYISSINSIRIFHKEIKFLIGHKQNNLNFVTQLKIKGHKHNNLCTFVEGFKGDYFKGMTNLENIRFQSVKTVVNIGKKLVYNLTASDTHTYVANGFITHNTGGNVEKSKDAESMFFNPDAYYFKSFKNEGKDTGFFMGGTYRSDFKKPVIFTDWYNQKYGTKLTTSELNTLDFKESDTDLANKILDEEEKTAKSVSLSAFQKRKMYAPRTLTDMFLKTESNPFVHLTEEFEKLLAYLEAEESRQGKAVDLVGNESSGVTFNYSDKPLLTDYPISKNDEWKKDSAVSIIDPPRNQDGTKLYVIGLDPFNMIKASKEASLASFYVMRRETSNFSDPFRGRIVAWYNGRKDISHSRKIILQTLVLYGGMNGGCTLLHEASDDSLTQWFNEKNLGYLLEDTYALSREINPNSQVSNLKGMRPTIRNQNYYLGKILDYCEEVMPDGRLGLWRIPDPYLIKQLMSFSGDLGVCDSIASFGHTLMHFYKERRYLPQMYGEIKKEVKKKIITNAFGFHNNSSNFDTPTKMISII